jgi:hypothetical protein
MISEAPVNRCSLSLSQWRLSTVYLLTDNFAKSDNNGQHYTKSHERLRIYTNIEHRSLIIYRTETCFEQKSQKKQEVLGRTNGLIFFDTTRIA